MVTTIDGSFSQVTSAPLKAPQASPVAMPIDDQQRRAGAGLHRHAHDGRRQRHDRRHRQVDLAGDDQQRHCKRDQRLLGEVEGEVRERPRVEEVGRGDAVDREDRDGDDDQQRLPALQRALERRVEPVGDMAADAARLLGGAHARLRLLQDDAALAALAARVEHDGKDDGAAGDRHLPEGRDVDHRQRRVDDAEEQRAEHRARRRCRRRRRSRCRRSRRPR